MARRWRSFEIVTFGVLAFVSCRNGSEPLVSSRRDLPPTGSSVVPSAKPPPPASNGAPAPASTPAAPPTLSAPASPPPVPWPPAAPAVASDFCIEGVSALDEETCYVLPAAPTRELLLYLHGIVPPEKTSRQKTNFETVVQNASRRAGVAALMPRGELGLAPRGHEKWWGWPTTASAHAKWSPALLAKLADKRQKLEALVGQPFTRLYVAGSSSGAYYAIHLALSGALSADGFAALSGASKASVDLKGLAPKPFYIGYGSFDTVGGAALSLGQALRRAGWPVRVAEHRLPHGTAEIYLDEAFAFWRSHLTSGSK